MFRQLCFSLIIIPVFLAGLCLPINARVSGPCVNCHTMHNSQNGQPVDVNGPNKYLLNVGSDPCAACHTGTNIGGGSSTGTIPFVNSTTEPTYGVDTLAAGNFYWVQAGNATKGHNCLTIPGMQPDPYLTQAPGKPDSASGVQCAKCHDRIESCESCHKPAHHADDTVTPVVGESGGWYRFLNSEYHGSSLTGVKGIEDDDWEYTRSSSDHNEYMGCNNPYGNNDNSMSNYCAGCHYKFHGINYTDTNGSVVADNHNPWFLHPTHLALADTDSGKEYHNYNDGNGYSPFAPVARDPDRLASMTGPDANVYVAVGTTDGDQVMCLSCHRAHGTPYNDMLRWDYSTCNAGTGSPSTCGCYVCHTTKDQ